MTDSQFQDAKAFDRLEDLAREGRDPATLEDRETAELLTVIKALETHRPSTSVPRPEVFHRDVMETLRAKRRRPRWVAGFALAAAVLTAIFLPTTPPSATTDSSIVVEDGFIDRALAEQTRDDMLDYLKSTERLLLAMRDFEVTCREDQTDLQPEKRIAKTLLMKQKLFKPTINTPEYYQARQLFNQLEGILVDVNLLDNCTDPMDVEFINQHIERNRILGKLRLVAQEIRIS